MNVSLEKLKIIESIQELEKPNIPPDKRLAASLVIPNIDSQIEEEESNIVGDEKNLINRRALIKETAPEPVDFAFERAIGNNDSVYSNFAELIIEAKKKVGRIAVIQHNAVVGYATGFMVSDSLMLTNWHVMSIPEDAEKSTIEFNYEYDIEGNLKKSTTFALDPHLFFHSNKELDYCLVAVKKRDLSNTTNLSLFGYLHFSPLSGKLGDIGKEALNIIHHPDGDPKQLSIRENIFTKVLPNAIWYESDTAQGSSGSPVFNDQWQVVALHHMGVASKNVKGEYLDKEGAIVPVDANNRVDMAKIHWIANEGIRISVIQKDLEAKFANYPLIANLLNNTKPRTHETNFNPAVLNNETLIQAAQDSIHITVPSMLLRSEKNLVFQISSTQDATNTEQINQSQNVDQLETLKLERSMDYSDCKGYITNFLGGGELSIGIPKPLKEISHKIARLSESRAYVLKYHKYSVIFNAERKLPFISAINVDGDPQKRLDTTKRKDKWIRDTRIPLSIQLDDKYYEKSGFDKGHMSRREDANWGDTPEEAKLNADLTCVHTNAAPQVPALNRHGLWGDIEDVILEHGAMKEEGNLGKISVFSGPVFQDDDPVYNGNKVPMKFYKVLLWFSDANKLRATAFILSQSELVADIEFEAIDIDQNVTFKQYQCSIPHLTKLTSVDFSEIEPFDTYNSHEDEMEISTNNQLLEIAKNN